MRDGIAGEIAGRQSRARTQYNWRAAELQREREREAAIRASLAEICVLQM